MTLVIGLVGGEGAWLTIQKETSTLFIIQLATNGEDLAHLGSDLQWQISLEQDELPLIRIFETQGCITPGRDSIPITPFTYVGGVQ